MKRVLAYAITVTLLLCVFLPGAALAALGTATVRGGWLQMRAAPSFDSEVIASYYTGTVVTVLGSTGQWYHVSAPDDNIGYMYSAYLVMGSSYPADTTTLTDNPSMKNSSIVGSGTTAYIYAANGGDVRLRSGPGTEYSVIGTYSVGRRVTILSRGTQWHFISVGNQTGYMMAQFLTDSYNPYPPTPSSGYTAYVTSGNGLAVRLRTGPGLNYSVISSFSVGTAVQVLQHNATWDYVQIGVYTGYMMNQYLTTSPSAPGAVRSVGIDNRSPSVGTILTARVSPASADVTYQWTNEYGTLLGQTANYPVQYSDIGHRIRVTVYGVGTTTGYAVSAFTNQVTYGGWVPGGYTPTPVPITPTVPPVYPGTALQSITLSSTVAVVGVPLSVTVYPAGATVSYNWYRNDGKIVGFTQTYTPQISDASYSLYCVATGLGTYTGTVVSASTSPVQYSGGGGGGIVPTMPPIDILPH